MITMFISDNFIYNDYSIFIIYFYKLFTVLKHSNIVNEIFINKNCNNKEENSEWTDTFEFILDIMG
jgi:hypothetical protein